jgi:hypothetical protein
VRGRPSLLTPELVDELAGRVAAGELGGLSAEAQLVLALDRAEDARPEDWRSFAARLVLNEVEWRALLAELAAEDVYAGL